MDLDDLGLLSIIFIIPYAIALQILLIVFVRKYTAACREMLRLKQGQSENPYVPATPKVSVPAPAPVSVPAPAPAVQAAPAATPAPVAKPAPVQTAVPAKKRISSTSIIFGVGVLLLTIVGASFLSVSWSFMGDAARAFTLLAAVAVVYFLSFLSGHVLKLRQTGFAFYTLGSFLGPIVILGLGMYRLFGEWFSFKSGNGWMVAAVATALMVLSALLGKYIYKSKFYTGITYFSFTWLIVFVFGQIGDNSLYVYPHECIFFAIGLLTLLLRVVMVFKGESQKLSFKIYSEVLTFGSVVMMMVSVPVAVCDGSSNTLLLIGSVFANAALILHACFTPKREWVKYLAPFAAMCFYFEIICFDFRYPHSVWKLCVLFAALYAVFFFTKLRTLLSDVCFSSFLILTVLAFDQDTVPIFVPVVIAGGISVIMAVLSAFISKNKACGGINAALAGAWYYITSVELMLRIIGDMDETLYFLLVMPIPLATSIILILLKRFWKDDYRFRVSAEVLLWASLFFGTIYEIGAQGFRKLRSFRFLFSSQLFCKTLINGVLLLAVSLLLAYIYYVSAKKKDKLNIPSLIVFALALNAPAYVAFVPSIVLDTFRKENYAARSAFTVMFIFFAVVLLLMRFAPLFKKEKIALYVKPMKHIASSLLCFWLLCGLSCWKDSWILITTAVIMLVLYFCGTEFASALPLLIFEIALGGILRSNIDILGKDLLNIVIIVAMLAQFAAGRIFYKKLVFSNKGVDYLAFMPVVLAFSLKKGDYVWMLVFLAIALMIFNFIGRTRMPARVVASIAMVFVTIGLMQQPFINLSDQYETELILAILLACAAVVRFLIKPAQDKALKYSWFALVALCLTIEGISAAVTGYTFDLIVTGVAAAGIFLFSFIQKSRLWFILGVVSIIGIAVYLSATFWSSMAWLLYLLIAGIIMIVIAAGNEWRKRHPSEGKKLFKEWKW